MNSLYQEFDTFPWWQSSLLIKICTKSSVAFQGKLKGMNAKQKIRQKKCNSPEKSCCI